MRCSHRGPAMRREFPHRQGSSALPKSHQPTVCVVDSDLAGYDSWPTLARAAGIDLQTVATADEALRLARETKVDLWVINAELTDFSGPALCGMLKAQDARAVVYMVADQYSPGLEQAALQARATLFGCKGD